MVKAKNDSKVAVSTKPSPPIKPQIGGVGKMSPAIAKMIQEYGTNNNSINLPVNVSLSKMSLTSAGKIPKDLIESHAYRKINGWNLLQLNK
jgi:ribosomal protein L11